MPRPGIEYPRGLGMDLARFERVELLASARTFRAILDERTLDVRVSRAPRLSTAKRGAPAVYGRACAAN